MTRPVAVRWRNGSRGVQVVAALHIGWRSNEYRLQEPGHGDPDFLDRAWTALENDLPPTVARLASRSPVPADYGTIIAYIAGAGVRHPTFGEHARAERSARGEKAPEGDAIQWERVSTLRGSFTS